ncbi:MAG: hypothetical protein LBS10_00225 [Gracilibacteraceae bacterium]|jgi:hypothetical protein|nr:hypothetical protein [Gracilibacteraceae bacterium]
MDKGAIYAIKKADEKDYKEVAIQVEIRDYFNGVCYVVPPERGHMIDGMVTKETDEGFKFNSTGYAPGEWTFTLVTLANFRKDFHRLIIGGAKIGQEVNSTEELNQWFNDQSPA